jgi:hypothetical protein
LSTTRISTQSLGADEAGRMPRRRTVRRALALFALAGTLFGAVAAPAAAAAPSSSASTGTAATKPVPSAPSGVAVGREFVPKAQGSAHGVISPLTTWTVSISASVTSLWPTQYTTVTAKANHTVSGTIYYIDIYNDNTDQVVAACGSGTSCSVALTSPTPAYVHYDAVISSSPTDPNDYIAYDDNQGIDVEWLTMGLSFTGTKYTVPVGNTITLTEKSGSDVGPTPFYVELWDTTTGTLLNECGSGTTCTASVSQSTATTHAYVATFSSLSATYPPTGLQSSSLVNYLTWTSSGIQVSLSAPAVTVNTPETVTATSTVNVGSTPYWIQIFDEKGTRLASCGTGTSCSVSYTPSGSGSNLIAFVSDYDSTLPPADIQASSNAVHTRYERLT